MKNTPLSGFETKIDTFSEKMCIEASFDYVIVRLEFPNKVNENNDVVRGFPPARELEFQFFEGSKNTLQNTSC